MSGEFGMRGQALPILAKSVFNSYIIHSGRSPPQSLVGAISAPPLPKRGPFQSLPPPRWSPQSQTRDICDFENQLPGWFS